MLETLHSGAQVRGPHNPEAAGSNPVPATIQSNLGISTVPRFFYVRNGLIPMSPGDSHLVTSSYIECFFVRFTRASNGRRKKISPDSGRQRRRQGDDGGRYR